ncbi:hypothetical protein MOV08_01485 [Streptomyces yunnanensis]|uniref:AAA ATPase domain-containing protein n=1 Tax=Streptomyces yunnanensis TaxID=156453 RepID=A0ABY7ZZK7_9ACTN|nr:hypothetical protein [Streptomyces yunnanensis]WEB38109.1 hypothetical protein MOV08_01485 [Streptomyces yunnanensis]
MLHRSIALSAHQRDALESALGVRSGTPSGFAVGAAALVLLDEAVRTALVLLLLDDPHWIDSSSPAVFTFLQRRCAELPLVIVGATRTDPRLLGRGRPRPSTCGPCPGRTLPCCRAGV